MMDLPQIITANAVGLMLMLILLMHMRGRTRSALVSDRLFVAMVYLTAVLCVLETASFLVDGRQFPGARLLNYVSNALLFALDIVFAYLWVLYADFRLFGSHARLRRRGALLAVPAAAVILMDLCGVFFTVSPENVYSRRPLVFLSYLLTYFYLAFGSAIICRNRRKVSQYIFMPVSLLMGPIAVGSVIQFFCYGMATLWVCVAVGITSLYIITQTQSMYVDSLSGLYNRLYLDSFLSGECDRGKPGARLAGILWHQGESDSKEVESALTYAKRLRVIMAALIARIREAAETAGIAERVCAPLPVLVGELGEYLDGNADSLYHREINAQLAEFAALRPEYALVRARDLPDRGDRLHFSAHAQRRLGIRYACAWMDTVAALSPREEICAPVKAEYV